MGISPNVVKPTTEEGAVSGSYTPIIVNPSQPPPPVGAYTNSSAYGNFLRPFAANSLWNSYPVNPVFDPYVIPADAYFPLIAEGQYSTGVFEALSTDKPMVVYPLMGKTTIHDPDAELGIPSVTIPRWPAATAPSLSGDGHCDIVDAMTGMVHSFWQLKKVDGVWRAAQYAWTEIDGTGWGDPIHYFQGARAAAVPPIGGLIRKHEVADGKDIYNHALSVSLAFSGLSPSPDYVFPATSADTGAYTKNKGKVPEGALLMLPASFDTSKIANVQLRKVANTLKKYGAYVIDQNAGTPFYIYVENGCNYNLHANGWDSVVGSDLHTIRAALRMVTSAEKYIGGDGKQVVFNNKYNVLSMRGQWDKWQGDVKVVYNSYNQCLDIPATVVDTVVKNSNCRGYTPVKWAKLFAGDVVSFSVKATNGARVRLQIYGGVSGDTGYLGDGESKTFTVPTGFWYVLWVSNVGNNKPSSVSVSLSKV